MAGKNVYLTDKEILALTATCSEWGSMMSDGDQESCDAAEERLNNGLGSALKKLYKGRKGYEIYKKY